MHKTLRQRKLPVMLACVCMSLVPVVAAYAAPGTVTVLTGNGNEFFRDGNGGPPGSLLGGFGAGANNSGAEFYGPHDVVVAPDGQYAFITDFYNNRIRRTHIDTYLAPTDVQSGNGTFGYVNGTGGRYGTAQYKYPTGISLAPNNGLYVGEYYGTIRLLDSTGATTLFAGTPNVSGYADGPVSAAKFNGIQGIAVAANGDMYVADSNNNTVRKISGGQVTTLAGTTTAGYSNAGVGAFNGPSDVAVDLAGNILVADSGNHVIRRIAPNGTVTLLAGTPGVSGYADGPGTSALFDYPFGLAVDPAGNVYVSDYSNHRVRKIGPDGTVSTIAGNGTPGFANGTGGPTGTAAMLGPRGLTVIPAGGLYVADFADSRVRAIEGPVSAGAPVGTFEGIVTSLGLIGLFMWFKRQWVWPRKRKGN